MRQTIIRLGSTVFVAAAFLAVFSPTTSPIFPRYGGDAALFRVIGAALADGKQMYLDIWDHKGPIFFLYQGLGQAIIPGRLGIFLLQTLVLSGALLCFDAFARQLLKPSGRIAVATITLAYFSLVIDGGNLTEELSLVFCALVMWILTSDWLRDLGDANSKAVPLWCFSVAGAAFACVAFIRINNALPIFAFFLAFFVSAILRREQWVTRFLAALVGFLAVTAILLTGFALAGSLYDMLDATFLFNFRYASDEEGLHAYLALVKTPYFAMASIALLICIAGATVHWRRTRDYRFIILGAILAACTGAAVFASTNAYPHYLQTAIPAVAFGTTLLLAPLTPKWQFLALPLVALIACPFFVVAGKQTFAATDSLQDDVYAAHVHDILEHVPSEERAEVYPWTIQPRYYLIADTAPVHRFFTMQEWWGSADPRVLNEALSDVKRHSPKWILVPATGITSPEMQSILQDSYNLSTQNEAFALYLRD